MSTRYLLVTTMKPNAFLQICPSRAVLSRVGDKWTMLILTALEGGPARFGSIKRQLQGVSQKMLTQSLRAMERDGIAVRTLVDERPLRVDYHLTKRGQGLLAIAKELKAWAEANLKAIERSNERFDKAQQRH
jgi:DNA-binding HxlR family transcriptional regulator